MESPGVLPFSLDPNEEKGSTEQTIPKDPCWSNYSDLTRVFTPKWWFRKGIPRLFQGFSMLVKYYNLARRKGLPRSNPVVFGMGLNHQSYDFSGGVGGFLGHFLQLLPVVLPQTPNYL